MAVTSSARVGKSGYLREKRNETKGHKGEYIVKYPSEKRPYWHNLDPSDHEAGKYWVLLTIDK